MTRLCLAFVALTGALAIGTDDRLEVVIKNVERSAGQVSFLVSVRNPGLTPLLLEETTKGKREPYAVTIERATGSQGWEFVGPHRDTPPAGVFPLLGRESLEVLIVLPDPYPEIYKTPMRTIALVGRFRAKARYFHSRAEWERFTTKPGKESLEASSPSVTIAQLK